jgi:hypothetical protein
VSIPIPTDLRGTPAGPAVSVVSPPGDGPGRSRRLAVALLVPLLALASCSVVATPGETITESRQVSGFTKVELEGSGTLTIDQTGSESLTIEAGSNVMPHLTSDVSGDTLTLGVQRRTAMPRSGPISYRLTVEELTGITVSGSGSVTAPKITTDKITCTISGSGSVTIGGRAADQELAISGSGQYEAGELASKVLRADISGSGGAVVSVSETLDVQISGSGSLTYSGDPNVTKDVSGSGEVVKR